MRKIRRGSGFRGVLSYLLDHDEPEIISGTISAGSVREMTREFVALSETRPDIKKPVWHNSLRLPAGDELSSEKWSEIADDYMREIGMGSAQWIAIKHNHSDGEHIHIVANRVQPDSSIYLGKNENLKSTGLIAELERRHGLTTTESADHDKHGNVVMPERSKPQKDELEQSIRTGNAPVRSLLQSVIDEALSAKPTVADFADRLQTAGVSVRPNIASTGRVNGLAFELNGLTFSGSKLGKKFSWKQLQKRIDYKPDRDNALMQKLKNQAQKNDEIAANTTTDQKPEPATPAAGTDSPRTGPTDRQDDRPARAVSKKTQASGSDAGSAGRETENLAGRSDGRTDNHYSQPLSDASETTNLIEDRTMNNDQSEPQNRPADPEAYTNGYRARLRQEEDETRVRKKKHAKESTSGRKRDPASVSPSEMQRFKQTLALAFEQRGNDYYYKNSDKIAFKDEGEKIVGVGLYNADGTANRTAFKAMAQASQIKFGDEFNMTGSDEYKREMWLQAAMISCTASGYEPGHNDLAELKSRLTEYYSKYKRKPPALHPAVAERVKKYELDVAEARKKLNPNQPPEVQAATGVKSQLDSWRANREQQQQGRGLTPKPPKPN